MGRNLPRTERVRGEDDVLTHYAREQVPQGALGITALSASRSKGTFLAVRYGCVVTTRGKPRAIIATLKSLGYQVEVTSAAA